MGRTSAGTSSGLRRCATAIALVVGVTIPSVVLGPSPAGAASVSVNLAATRGAATGVGQGFLYGFTADGSQPGNQFVTPLRINAFRGGGHASRGWIGDGFRFGSGTQADINSAISTARRLS